MPAFLSFQGAAAAGGSPPSAPPRPARGVLFVGELTPYSRSSQRAAALAEVCECTGSLSYEPLSTQHGPDAAPLSFRQKVLHHLGWPDDPLGINALLPQALASFPCEVLLVEKALMLRPRTLQMIRGLVPGIRIVLYTEDNIAQPHNRSHWLRRCLPHYDLVVTPKSRHSRLGELTRLGAREHLYLAQSFDPELHRPPEDEVHDPEHEIGFVGTFEKPRARTVLRLAKEGFSVRVAGGGWAAMKDQHPRLTVEGPLYGERYRERVAQTRINLGFLRERNLDLHTCRSVEIPACGGFLLAPRTEEHLALFEEGTEACFFTGEDELIESCHRWLRDDEGRRRIAAAGRRRCVNSGYTHQELMRAILEHIGARSLKPRRQPALAGVHG